MKIPGAVLPCVMVLATSASARPFACPKGIHDAVAREFPSAAIVQCSLAHPEPGVRYDVQIAAAGHGLRDLTVSADGRVLEIDERVALDSVPAAVMNAFAARHPAARVLRAEQQITHQGVRYQLAFRAASTSATATYTEQGQFLGEE